MPVGRELSALKLLGKTTKYNNYKPSASTVLLVVYKYGGVTSQLVPRANSFYAARYRLKPNNNSLKYYLRKACAPVSLTRIKHETSL